MHFSPRFWPSIGGIETLNHLLCTEFAKQGHDVVVLTEDQHDYVKLNVPYSAISPESRDDWHRQCKTANVIFLSNFSWKKLDLMVRYRRRMVIQHHTSYNDWGGDLDINSRLKRGMSNVFRGVAVSKFVAKGLGNKTVIRNCYDSSIFFDFTPARHRTEDFIFVGRLVDQKGVHILIQALSILKKRGLNFKASIVGDGPDDRTLRSATRALGIGELVKFYGALTGAELNQALNDHKVIVIPSAYSEPFGIVALEGLASGCLPVYSNAGGLPEAVGGFGVPFQRNDVEGLANALMLSLSNDLETEQFSAGRNRHLAYHSPQSVARRYIEHFELIA